MSKVIYEKTYNSIGNLLEDIEEDIIISINESEYVKKEGIYDKGSFRLVVLWSENEF
jgi:hypothetical protein